MNSQQRAAMQMALEALEYLIFADVPSVSWIDKTEEAITALRKALAQPQGVTTTGFCGMCCSQPCNCPDMPMPTTQAAQPQGKPVAWRYKPSEVFDGYALTDKVNKALDAALYTEIEPLYPPPSVEAAIEATKEKAAKVCDERSVMYNRASGEAWEAEQCAAAIRSMK